MANLVLLIGLLIVLNLVVGDGVVCRYLNLKFRKTLQRGWTAL